MFDAHPPAFGSIQVRDRLADGRHGPVFLGHDPDSGQAVVIRTFEVDLDPAVRTRLLEALQQMCDAPLQHSAVGRPVACGLAGDRVFVVHSYLPGLPVDEWLRVGEGPRPLSTLLVAISSAAAAIDFAAAAGIHHGALGAGDVIIGDESAGVTGWGIEQARASAGLTAATPSHADDIAAFAAVVAMVASDAELVRDVFEQELPASALGFAAALHERVAGGAPQPAPVSAEPDPFDAPLRIEKDDTFDASPLGELDRFDDVDRGDEGEDEGGDHRGPSLRAEDVDRGASLRAEDVDRGASLYGSPGEPAGFVPRQHVDGVPRHHADVAPRPSRAGRWIAIAAGMLMLAAGFAGGIFVGREQSVTIAPVVPAVPVAATSGSLVTDAPAVVASAPHGEAVDRVANPSGSPAEAPPDAAATAPQRSSLQVDSRPQGAQVFVDGRFVGHTPVVAPGLRPGQHMVRLQMSGHRQWTTAVTLAAGAHARVGGSLEEQY